VRMREKKVNWRVCLSLGRISDCATVDQEKLQNHILELFHRADTNNDGVISDKEFETLFNKIVDEYPQLQFYR
jgi:Ca2+-binding EF-hand superfamily protein